MKLILICSNCGAYDDWSETGTKGIYRCQYCHIASSIVGMKIENEFYRDMARDIE